MSEKKGKISVCALTLYPHNTVPGQRYRIEQWEPYLNEEGIEIDYYPFADERLVKTMPQHGKTLSKVGGLLRAFLRRFSHLRRLREYDVILIYRAAAIVGPAFLEKLVKLTGRPIIFDFDDAIFLLHTSAANKLFGWAKFPGKTASICALSTSVTVGNRWLAEYALKHNRDVTVIPSSVDVELFAPRPRVKRDGEKVIVGWTGSSTSQTYLEMFAPVLRQLLARRADAEIHVHSDRPPDLPGVPVVWHPWSPDNEVEVISKFDIGIMPMPEDVWSRGKCSMKALLYMSLGIATVCESIGMNTEVIKHGENGFLAKNTDDWLNFLETLIDNSALREKFGEKARETVVENYSMRGCAKLFARVVRRTVRVDQENDT